MEAGACDMLHTYLDQRSNIIKIVTDLEEELNIKLQDIYNRLRSCGLDISSLEKANVKFHIQFRDVISGNSISETKSEVDVQYEVRCQIAGKPCLACTTLKLLSYDHIISENNNYMEEIVCYCLRTTLNEWLHNLSPTAQSSNQPENPNIHNLQILDVLTKIVLAYNLDIYNVYTAKWLASVWYNNFQKIKRQNLCNQIANYINKYAFWFTPSQNDGDSFIETKNTIRSSFIYGFLRFLDKQPGKLYGLEQLIEQMQNMKWQELEHVYWEKESIYLRFISWYPKTSFVFIKEGDGYIYCNEYDVEEGRIPENIRNFMRSFLDRAYLAAKICRT